MTGGPGVGAVAKVVRRRHLGAGVATADRDERVALGPQLRDDLRQRGHRFGAVTAAVVHVDHRPGERGADDGLHDGWDTRARPVLGVDRIAHGRHPARRDLAQDGGVPGVVGRADALRRRAGHGADLGLCLVDLRRDRAGRQRGQVGMAPGVVLDRIAGGGHHLRVLRVLRHLFADLEERRGHVILLQHREDGRRIGTGPVVEGEGDHLGPGGPRPAGRLPGVERRTSSGRRGRRRGHLDQSGQRRGRPSPHPPRSTAPVPGPSWPFLSNRGRSGTSCRRAGQHDASPRRKFVGSVVTSPAE